MQETFRNVNSEFLQIFYIACKILQTKLMTCYTIVLIENPWRWFYRTKKENISVFFFKKYLMYFCLHFMLSASFWNDTFCIQNKMHAKLTEEIRFLKISNYTCLFSFLHNSPCILVSWCALQNHCQKESFWFSVKRLTKEWKKAHLPKKTALNGVECTEINLTLFIFSFCTKSHHSQLKFIEEMYYVRHSQKGSVAFI